MNTYWHRYLTCLIALMLICTAGVFAQSYPARQLPLIQSYLHNEFNIRNQNWAISQHPTSHFIYFANSEGLIEYNGISWEKHTIAGNQPVRSVLAHTDGIIYTGSFEEYGYWQHNQRGEFHYISLAEKHGIEKNDEIWKIFSLNGKIYFQSFTSVYIYDGSVVEQIMAPYTMLFMHQLEDRFIVQIIDEGLFYFIENEFVPIEGGELFANRKVHAIVPYKDDQWLVCTEKEGIFIYDGSQFTFFQSQVSEFLKNYTCNVAKQLTPSSWAFGTILNGIVITNEEGSIQRFYNTNKGLNNNTVLSLFLDADMGLWAGLDEGVAYIDLKDPFTHYRSNGGALGTIYALLKQENQLLIGTNHGLFRADIHKQGEIYDFRNLRFIEGSQGQVWALQEFDGQVLCGHNEGTFSITQTGMDEISPITGGWAFSRIGDLIAVGTYTGIIMLEQGPDGKWIFRNKIDNFAQPTRYIETDYLGYVWASHHQKGIFKIELSADANSAQRVEHFPRIGNKSLNIKVFKVNNRIVFTTGENIYTWDFVRNEIVPFEALSQHLDDFAQATQISHYKNNQYWFIREDRMALFEISLDFTARKVLEIPQENINLPQRNLQILTLDAQTLLLPNPQIFDAFNMEKASQHKDISRLRIERMDFYGKRDTIAFTGNILPQKIPSHSNNLAVTFADPASFGLFSKTYHFRIKELDLTWQTTRQNHFTYLDLKHGKYTLEIARETADAVSVEFTIAKPWHISNGAIALYLLTLAGLIWGIYVFFRFEIKRQRDLAAMEIKQNSLEKELDYKSYELMLTMRHLLMKDNILNELKKQITQLQEQSAKYPVKHIRTMEKVINQGLGSQSTEWENALNNLKLSQQGFFRVLKDKYPSLTTNDLRMCSYLRMNFNTKEIAQMLNVSTRGVEVSRHRLRKKLNLSHDENLVEFLMSQEFNFSE
ncbi:MAG: LuxR C-terminal-related transcriptional regulator [Bacteroidota bacterium]